MISKQEISLEKALPGQYQTIFTDATLKHFEYLFNILKDECRLDESLKNDYIANMQAVYLQLLSVSITKTQDHQVVLQAIALGDQYLESWDQSHLIGLKTLYNNAFGSSSDDGVLAMAEAFCKQLIGNIPDSEVLKKVSMFFYALLEGMLMKIEKVKLGI